MASTKSNKTFFEISPSMSTKKINEILASPIAANEHRSIFFKKGNYGLTETLILHNNTNVYTDYRTTLIRKHKGRMLELAVDKNTTGYNGAHDILWFGGKFVPSAYANDKAVTIALSHGENIILHGIEIVGSKGYHSIEINACRNVFVDAACISKQECEKYREAIQIDFAHYDGLKIKGANKDSACYDGTHCENITIANTIITDCPSGIGTHTVGTDGKRHENIRLINNSFDGISHKQIRLVGMNDVYITGNAEVHIDSLNKAHKLTGGKVSLKKPAENGHIVLALGYFGAAYVNGKELPKKETTQIFEFIDGKEVVK